MSKPRHTTTAFSEQRPDLQAHWMPFTANRQFKAEPRLLTAAQGMYYRASSGAASWTAPPACGASTPATAAKRIVDAVQQQVATMDYAPPFQIGHPAAFELANRLTAIMPPATSTTCSSPTPAPKRSTPRSRSRWPITACAAKAPRTRLIGRERGYHGVGFGGISVGGMVNNRKFFGALLNGVDHLPHTHNLRTQRLQPRPARMGRASGRRARAPRGAARRLDHRRGDRRAGGRLHRRAGAAEGLSAAPARDLRQARHPADLRRGDHRLRPARRRPSPPSTSASCPT